MRLFMFLLLCSGLCAESSGVPLVVPPAPFAVAELVRGPTTLVTTGAGKEFQAAFVSGDKRIHAATGWPGPRAMVISAQGQQLMQLSYWGATAQGQGWPYNDAAVELRADAAARSFGFTSRFATVQADDSTFTAAARLLDDGRIGLSWENAIPAGAADPQQTLIISSAPYGAFEGMRIDVGGKEVVFSPVGESGGKRTLFEGDFTGVLTFMPDQPARSFAIELAGPCRLAISESRRPEDVGRPYQYAAQVAITPKTRDGVRLTLDLGRSSAASQRSDDSFAGLDFWRDDRLHIPNYGSRRNLLSNPSFEGGMRYWLDGYWFEWGGENQDNFAIDETVAWRGRRSLKIRASRAVTSMMFGGFVIPTVPGRKYAFSFSGRSESPDFRAGFRVITAKWGTFANLGDFRLGTEWSRQSATFTAPNDAVVIALHPQNAGTTEFATGWIDGLQLEEAEAAGEYAEEPATVALLTASRGNYLRPGAAMEARLRIDAAAGANGTVDCTVEDFFYARRFSGSFPFTCDGGGEAVVPLPLDGRLGTGIFVATTVIRLAGGGAITDHHRICILDPAPASPNKGLFASMFNISARFADFAKRCSELGFGSTNYASQEPHAAVLARNGISNLGASGIVTHGLGHSPTVRKELIDRLLNEPYSDELAARLEAFSGEAVKANPWIDTWFMAAEARLQFKLLKDGDDEGFVKYILACRRGVKRADPGLKFLFDGGPDNMNPASGIASIDRWLGIAARLAPDVRFDGFAIHPYRYAPEQPDFDEDTAIFLGVLTRHGYPTQPVFFNEGIYNAPWSVPAWHLDFNSSTSENDAYRCGPPSYHMGWAERMSAAYFARSWLVALKYGDRVKQLNGWCQGYLVMDADMTHLALAKIPNTLGHLLGDARFVRDIRFAVNCRSYVFEDGQGRPLAALWSHIAEVDRGRIPAPVARIRLDPAQVEIFDLMGERVVPTLDADGAALVPVTPFPLFLRSRPGTREALCTALREAEVSGVREFPLEIEMRLAARDSAELLFVNRISKPFDGSAQAGDRVIPLAIPEAGTVRVPLPLAVPVPFDAVGDLSLPLTVADRKGATVRRDFAFHACAVAKAKPGVEAPWIPLTNWRGYTARSSGRLAASYRLAWSASALRLEVQVVDAKPTFPGDAVEPGQAYNFDSLQIYIDTLGDNAGARTRKGQGEAFGYDNYGYMVSRHAGNGTVFVYREAAPDQQLAGGLAAPKPRTLDTEIVARIVPRADGYVYEIEFPRHLVAPLPLQAGTFARLGLMVNANDGEGRIGGLVNTTSPESEPNSRPEEWPGVLLVE